MKKQLYIAVGCNEDGEWAEFTKSLDESDYDSDIEFKMEMEELGFSVVAMYRVKDVVLRKAL